ncbi:MAG: hypothetical protein KJZ83_02430 [Burkholderiaceae bacterium]|nr:hypothetical protein [Burkholderiaceae bacterium]
MVQVIGQNDIVEMLTAFQDGNFVRFTVTAGATRISASRSESFPADTTLAKADFTRGEPELVAVQAPSLGIFRVAKQDATRASLGPGDRIGEETVLGLIWTRRDVTPVRAGRNGTVAAILASDGDFVEYGQALLHFEATDDLGVGDIR